MTIALSVSFNCPYETDRKPLSQLIWKIVLNLSITVFVYIFLEWNKNNSNFLVVEQATRAASNVIFSRFYCTLMKLVFLDALPASSLEEGG